MKKLTVILLCLALAMSCVVTALAENIPVAVEDVQDFFGTWRLDSIVKDDIFVPDAEVQALRDGGYEIVIAAGRFTFLENGEGATHTTTFTDGRLQINGALEQGMENTVSISDIGYLVWVMRDSNPRTVAYFVRSEDIANSPSSIPPKEPESADESAVDESTVSDAVQLKLGDSGDNVKRMNERLSELGYLEGTPVKVYTQNTESAVKRFQETAGLPVTGIADTATQEALYDSDLIAPTSPISTSNPIDNSETYSTLQSGDKGEAVERLKQRLIDLGYMTGASTGYYGPSTQAGIEKFQRDSGLPVTGIADEQTQVALYDSSVTPLPTPIPTPTPIPRSTKPANYLTLQKGDSGDEVRKLQQHLKDLNYLTGSVDGSYGNQTANAVSAFQQAAGLPETGIADNATQQRLFSGDAPRAKRYVKLDYTAVARDPNAYKGDTITFQGKILQVMESGKDVSFRIASKGNYDNVVYCTYQIPDNYSRFLEDDKVTVYGTCTGIYTYETVMGSTITIPSCDIDRIELR